MNLDFELIAIARLCTEEKYPIYALLPRTYFKRYAEIRDFIISYRRQHNSLPSHEFVSGLYRVELFDDISISDQFILNWLEERYMYDTMQAGLDKIVNLLSQGYVREAYNALVDTVNTCNRASAVAVGKALSETVIDLIEDYENYLAGLSTRYPLFFDSVNRFLGGGVSRGEMFVLVARPGMLKTWLLLATAHRLWLEGYRVLFISPEMNVLQITRRFVALHFGLSFTKLRNYELERENYDYLKTALNILASDENARNFIVIAENFDFRVRSIEVAIDRYRPDVVIVDALYLIRPDYPRGALWEQVKNVSDNLKRISVYYKIPVFTSTQFNRSVLSATEIDPAYVAYSDAIVQDADLAFALEKFDGSLVKKNTQLANFITNDSDKIAKLNLQLFRLKPLKIRDGSMFFEVYFFVAFSKNGIFVLETYHSELENTPPLSFVHSPEHNPEFESLYLHFSPKERVWRDKIIVPANTRKAEPSSAEFITQDNAELLPGEEPAIDDDLNNKKFFHSGIRQEDGLDDFDDFEDSGTSDDGGVLGDDDMPF